MRPPLLPIQQVGLMQLSIDRQERCVLERPGRRRTDAHASGSHTSVHAVYLQLVLNETTSKPSSCTWQEHTRVARCVLWEVLTALPWASKPSRGDPNTHCNYSFLLTAPAQHNCEACWGFVTNGKDVKRKKKKGAPAVLQDCIARLLHIIETAASWLAASVGVRAERGRLWASLLLFTERHF